MKYIFILTLLGMVILSCHNSLPSVPIKDNKYPKMDVIKNSEGDEIFYEKESRKANIDDYVFSKNNSFIYSYSYMKDGKSFLFKINDESPLTDEFWDFVPANSMNQKNIIKFLEISVIPITPEQIIGLTGIKMNYLNASNDTIYSARTGVIENYKNIWMHPPRLGVFSIIFTAPWPYVKFPLEDGATWTWDWNFNETWGDVKYIEWEGIIKFDYKYTVSKGTHKIKCPFGIIECYEIKAQGKSKVGENMASFYFNPSLGFVKINYTNMDGSRIVLEAIKYNGSSLTSISN